MRLPIGTKCCHQHLSLVLQRYIATKKCDFGDNWRSLCFNGYSTFDAASEKAGEFTLSLAPQTTVAPTIAEELPARHYRAYGRDLLASLGTSGGPNTARRKSPGKHPKAPSNFEPSARCSWPITARYEVLDL